MKAFVRAESAGRGSRIRAAKLETTESEEANVEAERQEAEASAMPLWCGRGQFPGIRVFFLAPCRRAGWVDVWDALEKRAAQPVRSTQLGARGRGF